MIGCLTGTNTCVVAKPLVKIIALFQISGKKLGESEIWNYLPPQGKLLPLKV